MSWKILGVPTLFDFTELPDSIELEDDKYGARVSYIRQETCELTGQVWRLPYDLEWKRCSQCDAELAVGRHAYCWRCGSKVVGA